MNQTTALEHIKAARDNLEHVRAAGGFGVHEEAEYKNAVQAINRLEHHIRHPRGKHDVLANLFEHDCANCGEKTTHIRHVANGAHHATSCMKCGRVFKPF